MKKKFCKYSSDDDCFQSMCGRFIRLSSKLSYHWHWIVPTELGGPRLLCNIELYTDDSKQKGKCLRDSTVLKVQTIESLLKCSSSGVETDSIKNLELSKRYLSDILEMSARYLIDIS